MRMAIKDGQILIKDISSTQFNIIKSWGKMKWNRQDQLFYGMADIELLNKLSELVKLPANIEKERKQKNAIVKAVDTERLLENPKPYYQYPIKCPLFKHQIRGANMAFLVFDLMNFKEKEHPLITTGKGFGFLFEMGCGKTLTAIAVVGAAYKLGAIHKLLIVAPSSVCAVWSKEFTEYADFKANVKILTGDRTKRLKLLNDLDNYPFRTLKVIVINYESIWREDIFKALYDWDADMIIADESQRIKTHNAKQSIALHRLGDQARYKLILSGTPIQNAAIDLYSQYRFLNATVFGDNFYTFRNRYAIMGGFEKKKIIGYRHLDELIQKEYSVAYRVIKEEALDLPEQTFLKRYITMTDKEKNIYERIKKESLVELENGGQITASTILTKLLRLQQLTGGFLVTDTKAEQFSKGKLNTLEEILDDYVIDTKKKLVIFARFRLEIDLIKQMLQKKKLQYGVIYGDVKLEDRGDIVKDFQTNLETKVFLAQIDTAGLGITLTAADTCVYYSVNFNYAAYSQSLARIHRIGQKNTCTYIHLIVENTVDETILAALARKEDLAKTIVDDWRNYF